MNLLEIQFQKLKTSLIEVLLFLIKVFFTSFIIIFASWLSDKKPQLAGFLIALPLTTIIALFFSYLSHGNKEKSIIFAKSIFIGLPTSLVFFIPFFFGKSLNLSFWEMFIIGLFLLIIGYFLHKYITQHF